MWKTKLKFPLPESSHDGARVTIFCNLIQQLYGQSNSVQLQSTGRIMEGSLVVIAHCQHRADADNILTQLDTYCRNINVKVKIVSMEIGD